MRLIRKITPYIFIVFLLDSSAYSFFNKKSYKLPEPKTAGKNKSTYLNKMSKEVSDIATQAKKALAFVSVKKTIVSSFDNHPLFRDPFFDRFFGPQGRGRKQKREQKGIGSGFIVDLEKGYVLTNNHVIDGAEEIELKLADGRKYQAIIKGSDKDTDVAVLEIKDKSFKQTKSKTKIKLAELVLANSDKISVGNFVLALGAPFQLEASVSLGIVSATGRGSLHLTARGNFIQTDAAINPGNSGGPLLNMSGEVVGINTAIYSKSGGYNGIGFAVPSKLVRRIANSLINTGTAERGFIGVQFKPLDEDHVRLLNLPKNTTGVLLEDVTEKGYAKKAGLKRGDVIIRIDGEELKPEQFSHIIGQKKPGESIKLTYYRNGKKKTATLKIGAFPKEKQIASTSRATKKSNTKKLGLDLSPLNETLKSQYNLTRVSYGLVVLGVEPSRPAWRGGLEKGDLIFQVNTSAIKNFSEFEKATKNRKGFLVYVERQGRIYSTLIKLDK